MKLVRLNLIALSFAIKSDHSQLLGSTYIDVQDKSWTPLN